MVLQCPEEEHMPGAAREQLGALQHTAQPSTRQPYVQCTGRQPWQACQLHAALLHAVGQTLGQIGRRLKGRERVGDVCVCEHCACMLVQQP